MIRLVANVRNGSQAEFQTETLPINGLDCFLTSAARAVVADGIDRQTLMKLFINHALEVLNTAPGVTPPVKKKNAEQVLQYALALHSDFDDPKKAA